MLEDWADRVVAQAALESELLNDGDLRMLRRERAVREIVDLFVPGMEIIDGATLSFDAETLTYLVDEEGHDREYVDEAARRVRWSMSSENAGREGGE